MRNIKTEPFLQGILTRMPIILNEYSFSKPKRDCSAVKLRGRFGHKRKPVGDKVKTEDYDVNKFSGESL
jgi:hypothetical protein